MLSKSFVYKLKSPKLREEFWFPYNFGFFKIFNTADCRIFIFMKWSDIKQKSPFVYTSVNGVDSHALGSVHPWYGEIIYVFPIRPSVWWPRGRFFNSNSFCTLLLNNASFFFCFSVFLILNDFVYSPFAYDIMRFDIYLFISGRSDKPCVWMTR